jgi:hypothetical protein
MSDGSAPRFASWFHRWWVALVGAAVAIGGGVIWLATLPPIGAASFGWFAYQPLSDFAFVAQAQSPLHTPGAVLFIAGLVAVAATLGYRAGRARG